MEIFTKKLAEKLTKKFSEIKLAEVNVDNGTFKVIASTATQDRHGEKILASGWKLENYMKNPIILFGHDYRHLDNVVGQATKVYVENDQLIVEGVFASGEANPKAQMLRKLYDEGVIRTVSVGLIPLSRDEKDLDIITSAELLELSFVPVPANPEALRLAKEIGAEELVEEEVKTETTLEEVKEEVKQLREEMKSVLITIKTFVNDKTISGEEAEKKELLQTANRALSEALRLYKKR